jgi:hypothetical protein
MDLYVPSERNTIVSVNMRALMWYNAPSGTAGNAITFTQAMTLDASGNLLVGKTSANSTIAGVQAISDGRLFATVSNDHTLIGNRLSSDGAIATFQKDGTTVGSIAVDWRHRCGVHCVTTTCS